MFLLSVCFYLDYYYEKQLLSDRASTHFRRAAVPIQSWGWGGAGGRGGGGIYEIVQCCIPYGGYVLFVAISGYEGLLRTANH